MPGWGSVSRAWNSGRLAPRRGRPGWFDNPSKPTLYRLHFSGDGTGNPSGDLARDGALALVEAALVAADEPLTAKRLAVAAGLPDAASARALVKKLQGLLDQDDTAFQVEEVAGGYQLLTRSVFHPWLVRLRRGGKDVRITAAARETLAIIAYRQPIPRADIEAIRGVQCSEVLRQLMEKGLVRMAGRQESLGRPQLYGTTRKFLQMFGLRSLRDLPSAPDLAPRPAPLEDEEPAE